jgi:2-dehydro-3-deoxygluconokinase
MAPSPVIRAIGEAMIEFAPLPDGHYKRGFAGDTFNTAWHMAQVLGPRADVGMVTRLGIDAVSDAFVAEMGADGMALSGIARDPVRSMGLYLIELDGVERSFHYWRSASAARHLADDPAILSNALHGTGLIHLSGITLAILSPAARETLFSALATARKQGAQVSFDPNIRPRLWPDATEMRATISRMLRLTDIALPSFDDEAAHFGDASPDHTLHQMADAGVTTIVVKNGAGAVYSLCRGQTAIHPTPAVPDIRDTTGAGDAFNAGFLASTVVGHPVAQAVMCGQKLAGCVLAHFGARATKQSLAELHLFPTT